MMENAAAENDDDDDDSDNNESTFDTLDLIIGLSLRTAIYAVTTFIVIIILQMNKHKRNRSNHKNPWIKS